MHRPMRAATLLAIAIGLVCPIASAAMIPAADIQPTGGGWTVGRISTAGAPGNVINRTPETSKYFAMGNVDGAGPFGGPYTARFRFIEPVSLGAMHLWNNFGTLENDGEGLADFTLTFRDGELDILGAHADRARDVFAMQTFVFAAPVAEVRYVDITIESNHDADLAYAGFHEISFVPEPAAILILALGAGLSRRRRTAR